MEQFERISEWIIHRSFKLSVWLIIKFNKMDVYDKQLEEFRQLKQGTLGSEIANCLDKHHLRLIPGFESHDLKHTLLNFKMTPIDEIRMQAFMIGNGNVSFPSIAIFIFGFILLPTKWKQFRIDFRAGMNSIPIKHWTIDEFAKQDLEALRTELIPTGKTSLDMDKLMTKVVYAASLFSMLAGGIGMIYCLPFLFSPILEDLVGAGFPFVGGALLFMAGLISLSIRTKTDPSNYHKC